MAAATSGHRSHGSMRHLQQEQNPEGPFKDEPSTSQDQMDLVPYTSTATDTTDEDSTRHYNPPNHLRTTLDIINQIRYRCGTIVNDENVQFFIVFLIAINAIMMGLATFSFVQDNPQVLNAFEATDKVFLIIFSIELGMQFIFHGWRLLLDGWLVFDLVVIMMSWFFAEAQIVRAFRIFRALRLVTRIEVMKNLVVAIFGVMPRMGAIGILLFLVSYIFAVMFTQLFKDMFENGHLSEDYFGRMDYTFFTLFQMMTFDSWSDITREVMAVYTWAWIPFIAYIIVTAFIVVNLIIAVICDAISALNEQHDLKKMGEEMEQQEHEAEQEDEYSDTEEEVDPTTEDLNQLEGEVEDLKRAQLQTLYTLEYLTAQVQQMRAMREAGL